MGLSASGIALGRAVGLACLATAICIALSVRIDQPAIAQTVDGRLLAPVRGQAGWLDLAARQAQPMTNFGRPTFVADIAAVDSVPFAVASVVEVLVGDVVAGADLLRVDLQSGNVSTFLKRQSRTESLDMPAFWQDGHGVLYQRSDLSTAVALEGQATLQYRSRIEQAALDGSNIALVVDDARYPGPAPDGSRIAFVRSTAAGSGIFAHSVDDGTDSPVVAPGQFLATAYPRYSPDGQQIAFAAISRLAPAGRPLQDSPFAWLGATTASAHGFPWEIWLVNADGTNLHDVPDLLDDDPSVAWSPDGSKLLIYGGWGSYVVTLSNGDVDSFAYVAGYGSVAWLSVAAPTSNGP